MAEKSLANMPSIGEVVRQWRRLRNLSVTEFAERAQVTKSYISGLENNKIRQPKNEQLEKLAAALGISGWDLVTRRLPDDAPSKAESDQSRSEQTLPRLSHTALPIFSLHGRKQEVSLEQRTRRVVELVKEAGLTKEQEQVFSDRLEGLARELLIAIRDTRELNND